MAATRKDVVLGIMKGRRQASWDINTKKKECPSKWKDGEGWKEACSDSRWKTKSEWETIEQLELTGTIVESEANIS